MRGAVHCVCNEVAEDSADHGGVRDVGEHASADVAHFQKQFLKQILLRDNYSAECRSRSHAVHLEAESKRAEAKAVVAASNTLIL